MKRGGEGIHSRKRLGVQFETANENKESRFFCFHGTCRCTFSSKSVNM